MNDDNNNSRPPSPDAPPADLWSSILDSVSSSRSTPAKQVLILGQPSSGKSAIAGALLQKAAADDAKDEAHRVDFALGYDFANVRDEADEDTLARLSVYTVPSSAPSYTSLLPHFLPPRTSLPHTLVVIVLDWTRPWTFVEELQTWLQWVENWAKGDGSRDLEIVREENRERLQSHLQHYTEGPVDPLPAATSTLSSTLLPLGQGSFTHNSAGVPIIVVCSKADLIDEATDPSAPAGMGGMVKGKGGEWEERTDGIMQVLRTICLKYGASLLYTTPLPATLQILRQHALHLLFMPPAPAPGLEVQAPGRNIFPFTQKPNTLDRDHILVPAGWDSWGKIGVLRDGFDAKSWNEAWERDLEPEGSSNEPGAKVLYAAFVPDQGAKPTPLPPFNNPVPEQSFLSRHYDENAKKSDRDPRGAFKNPGEVSAGIVGPLGSSSFNLPNVERALSEMESGMGPAGAAGATPGSRLAGRAPQRVGSGLPNSSPPTSATGRGPASPTAGIAGAPSPAAGGQSQHEVLQNFFQSLLNTKDRAGGTSPAKPAPTRPNGSSGNANGAGDDDN
ncbi:hypothetical protein D9611_002697 [Ephemerocybe angulata]|uniref:Dynein light intermediate chain n=1 Tax=Ephemerocybe angulata TaxID=980116 RepID=A0A8H5FEI0_9AGAR|nr:hypothetical protein D9611_002697 [Tulosesus angulatus]